MARFICTAMCAATAGVFALLASATIAGAQQPPADATTPPADGSPAPAAPRNEAAPAADKKTDEQNAASECKGQAEKPCRKNKICTWIIPKEADKTGQVPPAYCRKLGPTKAKAKNTAAPPAPTPEQKPPATSGAPPKN